MIASDDIIETEIFEHHLLMVAVALRRRSCLYRLAHQHIYLHVFALLAGELEEAAVLYEEVYVFAVLGSVPVVAYAA